MRTIYWNFYRIDNVNQTARVETFDSLDNINAYAMDLIGLCAERAGDRDYQFDRTRHNTRDYIMSIINDVNRDGDSLLLAERLARVEFETNNQIAHLNSEIPQGVLFVAYVDMELDGENLYKFVLAKADYTEFIEQVTGAVTSGLPTKKKIFKSFMVNINRNEEPVALFNLITFDPTKTKANYWWDKFLELQELRSDEQNTKTAMKLLRSQILDKIKLQHKEAYLPLYNCTVGYMRTEGDFDLEEFRDHVFGAQIINDPTFDMERWKQRITNLTAGDSKFDSHFTKKPREIKEKMYETELPLTPYIDLKVKRNFSGQENVMKPMEDNGDQGIFIKSDAGYSFANSISNQE
jgi:hypothetical protein